jgi:hypothetical protein
LWVRGFSAVAVQPTGVIVDVATEARAPVLRFGGAISNDTFVGAGVRVAVTPVHVDQAVRISTQLVDVLPITIEAYHESFWESPWGLVPLSDVAGGSTAARKPLYDADRDFSGQGWAFAVNPTAQIKVGPVIAFSDWVVTWLQIRPSPSPEPWLFEPYRGLVIAPDDRLTEHTSAVLLETADGEDRSLLRFGAVMRGKSSAQTPDETLTLGGLAQWRPGHEPSALTLTLLVAPYLVDPDFMGPVPSVALVASAADSFLFKPPSP